MSVFAQLFEGIVGNPPLRRTSTAASFNVTNDLVAQYTTSLLHYSKELCLAGIVRKCMSRSFLCYRNGFNLYWSKSNKNRKLSSFLATVQG